MGCDEAGKQHTKSFEGRSTQNGWSPRKGRKLVRGGWIDPLAGKVTFAAFRNMTSRLAPSTIDTRFTIVRGVFRAAVADRLIARDPTAGVVRRTP